MSYCTLKYVGYFQISFDIDLSHNSTLIREQTVHDFSTFRPSHFGTLFYVPGYIPVSPSLQSMGTWIEFASSCCVKAVEVLIMLNWLTVVFRPTISFYFSVYSLLVFESLILKLQLKTLISETTCNFVLYFPNLLKMYYHTFII